MSVSFLSRTPLFAHLLATTTLLTTACVTVEDADQLDVSTTDQALDLGDVVGVVGIDSCNIYAAIPGYSAAVSAVQAIHLPDLDTCYYLADNGADALSGIVPPEISGDVLDCVCEDAFSDAYGPEWHGWQGTGQYTSDRPAVISQPGEFTELYYRDSYSRLQETYWDGSAWQMVPSIQANDWMATAPSVAAAPGHRWVVFRNFSGDVILREWVNGSWQPGRNLGMRGVGAPTAIYAYDEVYLFGRDIYGNLVEKRTERGAWRSYTIIVDSASDGIASEVAVVPMTSNQWGFTVLFRGTSGALMVREMTHPGGEWYWRRAPLATPRGTGTIQGGPAAIDMGGGNIDVYVRGSDNHLLQLWRWDGGWSDYVYFADGVLASAPGAASANANHRVIAVRGTDSQLDFLVYN